MLRSSPFRKLGQTLVSRACALGHCAELSRILPSHVALGPLGTGRGRSGQPGRILHLDAELRRQRLFTIGSTR